MTFETSILNAPILSSSDSIWNGQWAATTAQFHLSADKCSDGMSFYVQPIVTPLCCSCSICVTRQRQFESLSLQRHNHHNSESTQDNLMKLMIFTWLIQLQPAQSQLRFSFESSVYLTSYRIILTDASFGKYSAAYNCLWNQNANCGSILFEKFSIMDSKPRKIPLASRNRNIKHSIPCK